MKYSIVCNVEVMLLTNLMDDCEPDNYHIANAFYIAITAIIQWYKQVWMCRTFLNSFETPQCQVYPILPIAKLSGKDPIMCCISRSQYSCQISLYCKLKTVGYSRVYLGLIIFSIQELYTQPGYEAIATTTQA